MEISIAIIGGLIFTLSLVSIVFIRITMKKKLQLLDWFLISLGVFNGVGFSFVLWMTSVGRNYSNASNWLLQYDTSSVMLYLVSNLILVVSVSFGWYLSIAITSEKSKKIKMRITQKKILKVAWICLFSSFTLYWLYTRAYGGFAGILIHSRAIRAGVSSIHNPYSFLKPFGRLAYFASYLFFGMLIDKKNIETSISKKTIFIGFLISFVFSIYVLYDRLGRFGFVSYFATFTLAYVLINYKTIGRLFRRFIKFVVVIISLLIISDLVIGGSGSRRSITEMLAHELTFPFVGFINQASYGSYRWFSDVIFTPLYVLPQRIWGGILNIETASSYNTFIIAGVRKGQAGVGGEMPVDLLTFGYMQASILGVVVIGLIFGFVLWRIELKTKQIPFDGIRTIIYSNIIINIAVQTVLYGDTQHIVVRNYDLIIGFILIYLFGRITFKSKNEYVSQSFQGVRQ